MVMRMIIIQCHFRNIIAVTFLLASTREHNFEGDKKMLKRLFAVTFCMLSMGLWSAEMTDPDIKEVLVFGTKTEKLKLPGSGIQIDPEELRRQDYSDLNQVITSAPGVYVREEDGFGLRPNIGIRGATSDRSQKITLMEDGVLITPAPYSAPAAYYITNASRLHAVEVLKGPSAIQAGPHTVGGAVNLITRPVPEQDLTEVEFTTGTDSFHKVAGAVGRAHDNFGFLFNALSYGSDGFKQLDGGGNTGFIRNDLNLKARWEPETKQKQSFTVKLGFADEDADETYLGLTDADSRRYPERRYPASELDRFESQHRQIHFNHSIEFTSKFHVDTKVYLNKFHRSWNKFSGFIDGPSAQNVLRDPDSYVRAYETLAGSRNSRVGYFTDLTIDVTDNNRKYSSRGVQFELKNVISAGSLDHNFKLGLRYHKDDVRRHHKQSSYLMLSGEMISDGIPRPYKTNNYARTEAVALFVANEVSWSNWTVNVGVRYEDIQGSVDNKLSDVVSKNDQTVTAPGLGIHKQLTESIGLLAGIYRGFSPSGPGKGGVKSEESTNVEYGFRYHSDGLLGELIWFRSDYDNLLGRCRASDSDCDIGQEFSGGDVKVRGLEMVAQGQFGFGDSYLLTGKLNYTYSESEFETSFFSQFSQWGLVREGDELPYIPKHVGRVQIGIENEQWYMDISLKHQHEMREEPGSGKISDGLKTDTLTQLDLSVTWSVNDATDLSLLVRNVTDKSAIVSHRPYGARPNLPRTILGRVKYRF